MRITVLSAGSRGDIDPFLALALGLEAAGHEVSVWVPAIFEPRVRKWALRYASSGIDGERFSAIQPSRENALAMLEDDGQRALFEMMESTWDACRNAEAIVYHATMISIPQIAEKLGIPRFAVVQPPILIPTREFPCPLFEADAAESAGGDENWESYPEMMRQLAQPVEELVDTWRETRLGLPPRPPGAHPFLACDDLPTPVLYCSSPLLVPRPVDWPEDTVATGFWLLPGPATWNPSPALSDFLAGGEPPIYVGFGSMDGGDPVEMARMVVRALERTGQRGILATGWGGMAPGKTPDSIFVLREVPHPWLLPSVKAVVHHGGASTTGAGLRAGKPTFIVPFRGDQPYWGHRVAALGLGPAPIGRMHVTEEALTAAMEEIVSNSGMARRASAMGAALREEDGIGTAVRFIEAHAG